MVAPAQYEPVLDAVGTGFGFTVTVVVAVAVQPAAVVTVTVYVPDMATVEAAIVGFCVAFVYPAGPLQEYVPPPVEFSWMAAPSQYGPVLEAVGAGNGFTVTVVVAVAVQPSALVTVTVYVPDMAVVDAAIVGFWVALEYPAGPLHE